MPEEYGAKPDPEKEPDTPEQSEEDFLATARKQFEDYCSDEKDIREQAELDLRFVAGDQWDERVKTERITRGRPALTFNRCHTFVQNVANEARQMRGEIKFAPERDEDKDTADIKEGLARHIQYNSRAKVAYETAVDYSAGGSFGYYGFLPEYADDENFDQEVRVRTFHDPFAVYGVLIPACFGQQPQSAFVIEEIPIEVYKRDYPTSKLDEVGWDQAERLSQGWIGTKTVRVAEYWYLEPQKQTKTRKNPETGETETRTIITNKVCYCKMNGFEVLPNTKTRWMGKRIPIFAVLGKQIILDGKPQVFSIVRFQRDPQQVINAYKTRIAETLGTAPIQPYVVYEGQIDKTNERMWAEMNTTLRPYLVAKAATAPNGELLPLPQRQVFEPPIQSLSEAAAQEIDDMKATAGIFDASLGQKSNETSGKGIMARQQQSNVTNMHFIDNLERSFDESGTELAYVIPKYYDGARTVKILGEDEAPKLVRINQQYSKNGQSQHYKVGGDDASKDHVVVTMGRAFSSKRMESFDMISQLLQGNPQLLPMVGDILFRNSDLAGADQLAERFHKMLPAQLQENKDGDPAQQAQQLQAKLAQTTQQLQALDALAKQLQEEKNAKVVESQSKERIAQMQELTRQEIVRMQEATKISVAQISASKDANQAFAERELEQYKLLHASAHEAATQAVDHAHEHEMADKNAVIAQAQQASDQAHQQGMAEQE